MNQDQLDSAQDWFSSRAEMKARKPPEISDHRLLRPIGEGAYGEVWLAESVTGTYRAVKVVYRDAFLDKEPYEREFRGILNFEPISRTNEGFVDILQVGRDDEAGHFYYVMELADEANCDLRGANFEVDQGQLTSAAAVANYTPRTLRSEIQRRGRLPFEECVQVGLSLNLALGHLHRNGLIHRDIKPSNIIFVNGVPKLADIGLVTDLAEARSFVGTEGFVPPEGPNSPQGDLYSLGKVLYEIAMGKDRKEFPEPFTTLADSAEAPALAELNAVVLKACATDARQRYQSAEEMHEDLALLQSGKSVRKKRQFERRVVLLSRLSLFAACLVVVSTGAYIYQGKLTLREKLLSNQLQVNMGIRLMDQGDISGSLLWFAEAVQGAEKYLGKAEQENHRFRIGAILSQTPKLAHLIVPPLEGGKITDYGGSAVFSPDGKQFLISGFGPTVLVYDTQTGRILHHLKNRHRESGANFSLDGSRIVTYSNDDGGMNVLTASIVPEARVWDARSGEPIGQPLSHGKKQYILAKLSPDGRRVLTISRSEAQVWDADTGTKLSPQVLHKGIINFGTFLPDGHSVLTVSRDGLAQVWDVITAEKLMVLTNQNQSRFELSPDGRLVLRTSPEGVRLWEIATGQDVGPPFAAGTNRVGAYFSKNGEQIVTTQNDGWIRTWSVSSGEEIRPAVRLRPDAKPFGAAISGDGRRIGFNSDGNVNVWDLSLRIPLIAPIPYSDFASLSFSPDGNYVATAGTVNDPVVRIWDLRGAKPLAHLDHDGWIFRASFSPDGQRIVTASADGSARLREAASAKLLGPPLHTNHNRDYRLFRSFRGDRTVIDPTTGKLTVSLPLAPGTGVFDAVIGDRVGGPPNGLTPTNRSVYFAAFSPDGGKFITTCYDGTARLWSAEDGGELVPALKHKGAVFHAAFRKDGERIITASADWTAQVWNVMTGEAIGPPLRHEGAVLFAEFSSDGRKIITASYDMTAQVWDAATGAKVSPSLEHKNPDNGPVYTAMFNSDGNKILTASYDYSAQIWDGRTYQKTTPPLQHRNQVFWAEFSSDGTKIVTASLDGTAQIWDASTGGKLGQPLLHRASVNRAQFSRDSKYVVTASFDGTARVWDAATAQPLSPPLRHADKVWHAEFSAGGDRILTASSDGSARIWEFSRCVLPASEIKALAQLISGRETDATGALSFLTPSKLEMLEKRLKATR